jgi:hypothetical protein
LTTPVLADLGYGTMWAYEANGGLPFQVLIGRGGEVLEATNFIEASAIEDALEE